MTEKSPRKSRLDPEMKAPRHGFIINPYPDHRASSCPACAKRTVQRKVPLVILVEPSCLVTLAYTCRYCRECDLLIAHQHEVEHYLTLLFRGVEPELVGNPYQIAGTLDLDFWRRQGARPLDPATVLARYSLFDAYYSELRITRGGWYPDGQKPPVREPPPSREWVKPEAAGD